MERGPCSARRRAVRHALHGGYHHAAAAGTFFARSREGFQVVPLAGTGFQYGMAFAKGNDRLRGAVNQALAELRADGTWERFYRRWFEEGQAP